MGKLELWGPLGRFSKPSFRGALMGSCPLLQERRLEGWMGVAQSHRTRDVVASCVGFAYQYVSFLQNKYGLA